MPQRPLCWPCRRLPRRTTGGLLGGSWRMRGAGGLAFPCVAPAITQLLRPMRGLQCRTSAVAEPATRRAAAECSAPFGATWLHRMSGSGGCAKRVRCHIQGPTLVTAVVCDALTSQRSPWKFGNAKRLNGAYAQGASARRGREGFCPPDLHLTSHLMLPA